MALQPGSEYFDLSDYVGVLRRRWALIVALTLIGLVLGGVYYYLTPKKYAATVLVQVNALPSNANQLGGRTGGPVNMDNEAQIVVSAKVTAIVKSKLKSPLSVTGLAKQIHVAVPPNTTYLQITCTTGSADLAGRCANAFGKAYLYNRRISSLTLISSEIKSLDAEVTRLENSVSKLKAETGKGGFPPSSRRWSVAKLNLTAEATKLGSIENKVSAVTPFATSLAVANSPLVGQVVTPATTPFAAISPKKKLDLPSGLAAGLVIGLATAYLLDWRRPRLHTARDVQRKVDLPNVFSLADVKGGTQSAFAPPRSPTGQTFTELAQYVGAALGDGHHVVLVTACSAGGSGGSSPRASTADSGGTVAVNLAASLARTRGETILICADPRGVIPRLPGNADGRGFAELLAGTASLADVAREAADVPMLEVITPGLDAASAVYDMQYDKVQAIMRDLRREVRYVVINVPSPGIDADTFSVAEFADAAIVTLPAGTARVADLNDCLQRLERLRTAVLAAVLIPATGKAGRRGRRSQPQIDEAYVRPPAPREPIAREPIAREPITREPLFREAHSRPHQPEAEPAAPSPYIYSAQAPAPPARSADVRQADGRPADGRPADGRPADGRPGEPRHPDVRYGEPLYTDPLYSDHRPTDLRASDPRTADPRTADPRTADPRAADPRTSDSRPVDPRSSDPRPIDPRASEPRPADPRPLDPRATDLRPTDPRPADPRSIDPRPADPRPPDPRAADLRPADPRSVDPRSVDPRAADLRSSDPRPTDARPTDARRAEPRHPDGPRHSDPRLSEPREPRLSEPREPRLSEPREPRLSEPRLADPRSSEPRPSEPRLSEPRSAESRSAESRAAEGRPVPSFKPHPRTPQVQPVTRDESSAPGQSTPGKSAPGKSVPSAPVLRPVAGRRASAQGGGANGGSRHAAPAHAEESGQSAGSFSSAWRPRNVNETWPLPATGRTDDDEESGPTDPPSENLYGRYDRP